MTTLRGTIAASFLIHYLYHAILYYRTCTCVRAKFTIINYYKQIG